MGLSDNSDRYRFTVSLALNAMVDLEAELRLSPGPPEQQSDGPDQFAIWEPHSVPGDPVLIALLLTPNKPILRQLNVGEWPVSDRVSRGIRKEYVQVIRVLDRQYTQL